jgi:ubiquinone/menaquinone biosynthesis C-methylase UbiE
MVRDTHNLSKRTQKSFGYQWTEFADMVEANREHFLNYIYPVKPEFLRGKKGLDVACGFGRHIYYASQLGADKMVGLDFSDAIWQAKTINAANKKITLVKGNIYDMPFREESFDFAYSLGALHHLPDPEKGFQSILPLIRRGGSVFIWVYSKKRKFLNFFLEAFRKITTRIPLPFLKMLSFLLAMVDYFIFIYPYKVFSNVLKDTFIDNTIPQRVKLYARFPFRVSWADWVDRLSAPIRFYYDEKDLKQWAENANLKNITISATGLYGWRLYGEKS